KAKRHATAGSVVGPNTPTVRFDNATADGQAKPDATAFPRALGAIELLKNALCVAWRYPWPPVGNLNGHGTRRGPRRKRHRAARGRVLDSIVQQIDQYLFDQDTIQRHQRQVGWQVRGQRMLTQARLQVRQGRADHLFE